MASFLLRAERLPLIRSSVWRGRVCIKLELFFVILRLVVFVFRGLQAVERRCLLLRRVESVMRLRGGRLGVHASKDCLIHLGELLLLIGQLLLHTLFKLIFGSLLWLPFLLCIQHLPLEQRVLPLFLLVEVS